jgi:hypothetical protein
LIAVSTDSTNATTVTPAPIKGQLCGAKRGGETAPIKGQLCGAMQGGETAPIKGQLCGAMQGGETAPIKGQLCGAMRGDKINYSPETPHPQSGDNRKS